MLMQPLKDRDVPGTGLPARAGAARQGRGKLQLRNALRSKGDSRGEEVASPVAGRKQHQKDGERPVSLKILADYLGLCPATVSVVLNNVPGRSIPAETRERVRAAARKFNYQPSLLARSLRKQRTFTVGVLAPELSDGYHTMVMSGIGDHLMREGYFYFTAHHRHKPDMVEEYPRLLLGRGAEGLIAIDTALSHGLPVPVVAVAGHRKISGMTNVVLDRSEERRVGKECGWGREAEGLDRKYREYEAVVRRLAG